MTQLSYSLPELLGIPWETRGMVLRAYIEASAPVFNDGTGGLRLAVLPPEPVDAAGNGMVDLPATVGDLADLRYQLVVDVSGPRIKRTIRLGWFALTEPSDLADLVTTDIPGPPSTPLAEHIASQTAHPAAHITYAGGSSLPSGTVEGALDALDSERVKRSGDTMTGPLEVGNTSEGILALRKTTNPAGTKLWKLAVYGTSGDFGVQRFDDDGSWTGTNLRLYRDGKRYDIGGIATIYGTGSPEGVVTAPIGSVYRNTESGGYNGATWWEKVTGSGNTGWRAHGFVQIALPVTHENLTGTLLVSREDQTVTVDLTDVTLTGALTSGAIVASLPTGFRLTNGEADKFSLWSVLGTPNRLMTVASNASIYLYGTGAETSGRLRVLPISYPTTRPWPTP